MGLFLRDYEAAGSRDTGEINPDDINFTQKITFSTSVIFLLSFVFEIIMDLKETAAIIERAHISFIRLPWVVASCVPSV